MFTFQVQKIYEYQQYTKVCKNMGFVICDPFYEKDCIYPYLLANKHITQAEKDALEELIRVLELPKPTMRVGIVTKEHPLYERICQEQQPMAQALSIADLADLQLRVRAYCDGTI